MMQIIFSSGRNARTADGGEGQKVKEQRRKKSNQQ